jgi:hypothetical protein
MRSLHRCRGYSLIIEPPSSPPEIDIARGGVDMRTIGFVINPVSRLCAVPHIPA